MPTTAEEYLLANDNANEYNDWLIEGLEQQRLEDVDDLFFNPDNRDEELWTELGVNPELTVTDYDDVVPLTRDLDWVAGLAGISAMSSTQFFLDNRDDTIIKPVAYREQVVGTIVITQTTLIQAGKRLTPVVSPEKFVALQAKYVNELSFLKTMSNTELHAALTEFGAIRPIEKTIADSVGYVSRMTDYPRKSPQFREAVNQLIDADSKRAVQGMNRRAVEQVYTAREVGDDLNRLMVWIVEGGANTCSYCQDRAGDIQPYLDWVSSGLPGAEVCKGGDYCRCHLAAA